MRSRFFPGEGRELLVFFHGWGMDPESVHGLPAAGLDILCCFDYVSLASDAADLIRSYSRRRLAAWSLGVWAAARTMREFSFDRAVALNGTLEPVSAEFGIPPEIFHGTIRHWPDERARRNFYRRVYGGEGAPPDRPPAGQQAELLALAALVDGGRAENFYDAALIGVRDRIFPPVAQRTAWRREPVEVVERDVPHWPLAAFPSWREVLEIGCSG